MVVKRICRFGSAITQKGITMFKKLAMTGGAVALLSALTVGVPVFSYARCGFDWARGSATDAMPVEWELKRARQMIADLKPEISDNARRIAREKVQVTRLESQLGETEVRLSKTQNDIERLQGDLSKGNDRYTYNDRHYTVSQVKTDLGNRFKRFKTRRATADKLESMLTARKKSLNSAEQQMDVMLNARRQLQVEVENLQARLGALRVAQASSGLNLDDSHLSNTRELLDQIAAKLDVEEETTRVDVEYFGEIDLDQPSEENLLEEITAYFDGGGQVEPSSKALVTIQLGD
jgi:septal ring factor EnvC (AmiA/AmiB activator)